MSRLGQRRTRRDTALPSAGAREPHMEATRATRAPRSPTTAASATRANGKVQDAQLSQPPFQSHRTPLLEM
eukprot:2931750-Alexandrium_andersonii.AAC.1